MSQLQACLEPCQRQLIEQEVAVAAAEGNADGLKKLSVSLLSSNKLGEGSNDTSIRLSKRYTRGKKSRTELAKTARRNKRSAKRSEVMVRLIK